MKEINNKKYYAAKELAEMLGKNLKSYQKFLMRHAEEFERIKEGVTYFYPEDVIEKTKALCEKKPK